MSHIPCWSDEMVDRARAQALCPELWKGATGIWLMPYGRGATLAIPGTVLEDKSGNGNHGSVEEVRV